MQKLIDTVSGQFGSGLPSQKKVFQISSGQYAGRVIIVYPQTANTLVFRWADFPYQSWSAAQAIVSNSADYPASAFMDENFNVYVAYTVQTTLALNFVKLSFANEVWTVGSPSTVINVEQNYYPCLSKDSSGRLFCSWTYFNTADSRYYIRIKTSVNDGGSWGTGPSDLGTALNSGAVNSAYSSLVFLPTYVYCFYTQAGTSLEYRRFQIGGSSWETAVILYSGTNLDYNFSCAISPDRRIGIAFKADSSLFYKEFDGNQWSGLYTVDNAAPLSLNLQFQKNTAYVFFCQSIGTDQNQLYFSSKSGSSFTTPLVLNSGSKPLDKVFCFDQSASTQFSDKTTEASNSTSADVFHPTSNGLVKDLNDALYLGMDAKFNVVSLILSTFGISGEVTWQYWNGSTWSSFTPYTGAFHLTSSPKNVILWQDLDSVPSDWQQSSVNGVTKFWVRLLVTVGYTTAPVGSQITAVGKNNYLSG
jgi:hypothetical protein